jgi:hypothetical protein
MAAPVPFAFDPRPSIFMSTPTVFFDITNLAAVGELESHWVTALEAATRDPTRFALLQPNGSTLDPTRSGVNNRRYIM